MKKILIAVVLVGVIAILIFGGKKSEDEILINDTNDFYTISAKYPTEKMDKEGDMKEFVEYVVKQKQEEWKTGGELYLAEKDIEKTFPDRPKMQYQLDISYTFSKSNRFNSTSYVFTSYEYTGGAHGGTGLATFTFGKDGRLAIEDILEINNNNDIEITRLIEKKLISVLGENSSKETINEGLGLAYLRDDNTLDLIKCNCDGFFFGSNLQNFVVTDNGIKFIMSQYQVAPYAAGMPEVTLSYEELKPFLKSQFNIQITN
jgi:hypothetical protein